MQGSVAELKLGFGMQGMGDLVEPYLTQVCLGFPSVTYLEIGVGHGETLTAIAEYLREAMGEDWRAIGIELPDGYSFSQQATHDNATKKSLSINFESEFDQPVKAPWQLISVYLKSSHTFLFENWATSIQLALIDGCHGKKCATLDFLLLEPHIAPGGIVLMHDFGQDQVGQPQPHCTAGLNVRGAAKALGLMDNARKGWEFEGELVGDKKAGSGDMGVFQKL